MAIYDLKDLKDSLLNYKNTLKEQIKKEILICFISDFYKKRINSNLNLEEVNLTKTFSNFLVLNYIDEFYKKNFKSVSNYNLITQYLNNANHILEDHKYKKIVIINAKPIKKEDEQFNIFLNSLENLKKDVSIKNLGWYENDWFNRDIKLFNNLETSLTKLKKDYYIFDKELFDKITDNKFTNIKLDFKKIYHEFFNKHLIYSFEKFIFIPENYSKAILNKKEEKIIESFTNDTLVIFNNNINLNSLSKTGFLNNLNIFYKVIKNDCPIFFIQEGNSFNIMTPLVLKEFTNFLDLINSVNFKINKLNENNIENDINIEKIENDLLNKFWNNVLENEIEAEPNNSYENDLKQINTLDIEFNINNDFNKLIKDITIEIDELDINKNIEYKKIFDQYINLFNKNKNNLEIIEQNFDIQKYNSFKQRTNNFNLKQTYEFINKNFESLKLTLTNSKINKQDILNCYTLYLKVKTCYDQILDLQNSII